MRVVGYRGEIYVGIVNESSFNDGNYRSVGEDIDNCDVYLVVVLKAVVLAKVVW